MRPLQLQIRNLQSFGNNVTTINLNFNKPVLLLGRNLDTVTDGQIDSNGAGKTTIAYGIIYALYDRVLDNKIKIDSLINNINGKNLQVIFDFEEKGQFYRVDRYRKLAKHGTGCYILRKNTIEESWNYAAAKDGGHDITPDSSGKINDLIEEIIGLPYEIFVRLIIITSPVTVTPFLALDVGIQRDIMEELFGFKEISQRAEKLKELIKNNNNDLETLKKLDEQLISIIDRHNLQLQQAKSKVLTWESDHDLKIKNLEKDITKYNDLYGSVDFNQEEAKYNTLNTFGLEITKCTAEITGVEKDLANFNANERRISDWNTTHKTELQRLEQKLNTPIIFQSEEEIQEFDKSLKEFRTVTQKQQLILSEKNKLISENKGKIAVLEKDISGREYQKKQLLKEIESKKHELKHLTNSKCPYCSQTYVTSSDKISVIETKRDNLTGEVTTLTNDISALSTNKNTLIDLCVALDIDRAVIEAEIVTSEKALETFMVEFLGSSNINLDAEYQKTRQRQTIENEYELKKSETNPYTDQVDGNKKVAIEESILQLKSHLNLLKEDKEKLVESLIFSSSKNVIETKTYMLSLKEDLQKVSTEINPHLDAFESLKTSPPPARKTDDIQSLHDLLEHQDFLLKLLTKKDSFVRKALTGRYIENLNERIRYYLNQLGFLHKVTFLEDMTVKISRFSSEISYPSLSSGQKMRCNIALTLAFRDVLETRFGPVHLCFIDELIDSALGTGGVHLAVKLLKKIAKEKNLSMFLVTHRQELETAMSSKVVVELKNGFSSIVESDI